MNRLLIFFVLVAVVTGLACPLTAGAQDLQLGDPIRLSEEQIDALTTDRASASKSKDKDDGGGPANATADGDVDGFSVDVSNRNEVLALYHRIYRASENFDATHGWTGDVGTCNAGTTSQDLKDDVRRRVNYFRAMAGLSSTITFDATKNAKAQKAALIMSRQGALSHFPNTDFPGNPCLSADGHEAAGKSNLSLGHYGPAAVEGQLIDDGANNSVVGHRRWILYSRAVEMGTGDIPGSATSFSAANALWTVGDFGPAPATPPEIAWPPAGFVPFHLAPNEAQNFPPLVVQLPGGKFFRCDHYYEAGDNDRSGGQGNRGQWIW